MVNQQQSERRPQARGIGHGVVENRDGTVTLHANPRCSGLRRVPVLSAVVVDILWESNADRVKWCRNCAVRKVRVQ